jgi:hypothetical protein
MAPLQARQKRLNRASGDNARRLRTVLDNRPAGTSDQESILEQTGCSTFVDCPDLELRPAGRPRGSGAAILVSSGIPLPDRLVGYPNAVVVGELRTGALVRSPGVLRPWCRPRPRRTRRSTRRQPPASTITASPHLRSAAGHRLPWPRQQSHPPNPDRLRVRRRRAAALAVRSSTAWWCGVSGTESRRFGRRQNHPERIRIPAAKKYG